MDLQKSQLHILTDVNFDEDHYKLNLIDEDNLEQTLGKDFKIQISKKIFEAKLGQVLADDINRRYYLGIGKIDELTIAKLSKQFIKVGEKIRSFKGVHFCINISKNLLDKFDAEKLIYQLSNSIELGFFCLRSLSNHDRKESEFSDTKISFQIEDNSKKDAAKKGVTKSNTVAPYINGARYIEHLPANHFTPEEFVSRAKSIAKINNLECRVFDEKELQENKLNGILSVCEGSNKKAKMIILEYKPKNPITDKKFAIVGKGLTFDSGGISIKPAGGMHEMKYDMCGAAVTLHAMGAIASLGLQIPVIAAIGVAENMLGSAAIKPGDVYTAYNGLTVEVQNTDAEGRLVLGDVLSYVSQNYKPDYMVNLATLTGAVIVGLGHEAAGIMGNSSEMISYVKQASENSDERVWELPFWEEYAEDLKSNIADIKNITSGRGAGTITAGKFLEKFVDKAVKWSHIDIAGTAWQSKPNGTQAPIVTGYGVRLIVELASLLEQKK